MNLSDSFQSYEKLLKIFSFDCDFLFLTVEFSALKHGRLHPDQEIQDMSGRKTEREESKS